MKKEFFIGLFAVTFVVNTAIGQDIPQSQVPSLIVNSFQQSFPKAQDVEWEMDGANHKVEFETNLFGKDHNVWYDQEGKVIRHKEEIGKKELPKGVLEKIDSEFNGYRVSDVKKITEGSKVNYTLELNKLREEWKVAFDSEGNILNKIAD